MSKCKVVPFCGLYDVLVCEGGLLLKMLISTSSQLVYLTSTGLLVSCSYFGFIGLIKFHGLYFAVVSVQNLVKLKIISCHYEVFLNFRFQLIFYFSKVFQEGNYYSQVGPHLTLYLISFKICTF